MRLTRNRRGIEKGFVMTIKELAYSTQQHLQSRTTASFKRAHIYEMLAASFGFNSYAALSSEAVFTRRRPDAKPTSEHNTAIRQRCVELGYPQATADVVSSELPVFVANRQIDLVRLSDLVDDLRGESSVSYGDADDQPDDNPQVTSDHHWPGPHDEMVTPILLEGLEAAAGKGIALAHYALALIYATNEDDDGQDAGSSYWYTQAQQGRVLSGVEKEWADAHAKQLADAEKCGRHLREAARLGNKHALLDLAEQFGDPTFFEKTDGSVVDDPARVAEIAERLGRVDDARHWLTIAAEGGDIDAMRQLIEHYDLGDLERCWKWLYLAQLLGTDLTKSNHYAIHEDGSPYDDDVGGPAYVAGEEGVELAALDAEQAAVAQRAAQELFERIQHAG